MRTARIFTWETDSGEGLIVLVEDEKIVDVFTGWESPEDNSVHRLGLANAMEACLQEDVDFIHYYEDVNPDEFDWDDDIEQYRVGN